MPPKRAVSRRETETNHAQNPDRKDAPKDSVNHPTARSRKRKPVVSRHDPTDDRATRGRKRTKDSDVVVNAPPTQVLDVYVFGTNSDGELGLGDATRNSQIPAPVLNPKLSASDVGVVHIAAGGMHSAALTRDNKILTWGVNDEGTLGRNTVVADGSGSGSEQSFFQEKEDSDSDDDDDAEEVDINLKEATPTAVDESHFPKGTIFAQLIATDSATFALTREGSVYGWGKFRGSNGPIGFSPNTDIQPTPILIPSLQNVVKLAAGAQHVLALTSAGSVFSWGCGEQYQLGRRRLDKHHNLVPGPCALPTGIEDLGAGIYHSFAVHKNGSVYAWGSNNFGQTAIVSGAGTSDATVLYPTLVKSLKKRPRIRSITAGKDHSLAITHDNKCLIWGRIDNKALGLDIKTLPPDEILIDSYNRPRILTTPHSIPEVEGKAVFAAAGTDHSFVITQDGEAYSWGFNDQRQAGQPGSDEVERPTLLKIKYVKGKRLVAAAAGGQFSILAGEHAEYANDVGSR